MPWQYGSGLFAMRWLSPVGGSSMVKVMQVGSCQMAVHPSLGQGALVPPVKACGEAGRRKGVWRRRVPCCLGPAPGCRASSSRRLTVYRCITRIHLSNLQPCLPSSPREGAADQEKGKDSWKEGGSEREVFLCPKGLVSVCLNQEVRMWRQERQSRDILSVCVCVCVCTLLSWGVIYVKITASRWWQPGMML